MRAIVKVIAAALVVASLAVAVTACGGSGDTKRQREQTTTSSSAVLVGVQPVALTSATMVVVDALSTFKSKDPFIARETAPPTTISTTIAGGTSTTTATGGTTTTTTRAPAPTTTATTRVSCTLHSLKVLSIDTADGTPVVTFKVDDTVYEANREGDIVSTTWGQVKVLDIDTDDQRVTFLHGSELRTMGVGQEFLR